MSDRDRRRLEPIVGWYGLVAPSIAEAVSSAPKDDAALSACRPVAVAAVMFADASRDLDRAASDPGTTASDVAFHAKRVFDLSGDVHSAFEEGFAELGGAGNPCMVSAMSQLAMGAADARGIAVSASRDMEVNAA